MMTKHERHQSLRNFLTWFYRRGHRTIHLSKPLFRVFGELIKNPTQFSFLVYLDRVNDSIELTESSERSHTFISVLQEKAWILSWSLDMGPEAFATDSDYYRSRELWENTCAEVAKTEKPVFGEDGMLSFKASWCLLIDVWKQNNQQSVRMSCPLVPPEAVQLHRDFPGGLRPSLFDLVGGSFLGPGPKSTSSDQKAFEIDQRALRVDFKKAEEKILALIAENLKEGETVLDADGSLTKAAQEAIERLKSQTGLGS